MVCKMKKEENVTQWTFNKERQIFNCCLEVIHKVNTVSFNITVAHIVNGFEIRRFHSPILIVRLSVLWRNSNANVNVNFVCKTQLEQCTLYILYLRISILLQFHLIYILWSFNFMIFSFPHFWLTKNSKIILPMANRRIQKKKRNQQQTKKKNYSYIIMDITGCCERKTYTHTQNYSVRIILFELSKDLSCWNFFFFFFVQWQKLKF